VPILVAPYFAGDEVFGQGDAHAVLHEDLSQELVSDNGSATLRLPIPFVEKADIGLKKIGLEVIVRVGREKRTIILPPSLAAYKPRSAQFEDGALSVRFERTEDGSTPDEAPDRV
jgi:arsenite-transporting ATPase